MHSELNIIPKLMPGFSRQQTDRVAEEVATSAE